MSEYEEKASREEAMSQQGEKLHEKMDVWVGNVRVSNGKNDRRPPVKSRLVKVIFVIAATALIIFILANVIWSVNEYNQSKSYTQSRYYDEADYNYAVQYGDYDRLYQMASNETASDFELNETEEAAAALGFYYNAALLHKAYENAGMEDEAAVQLEKMEKYKEDAGKFSKYTDDVDEKVESLANGNAEESNE